VPPEKGPRKPAAPTIVSVRLPITLGQFLKAGSLVGSGGEAKMLIADGLVLVNGEVEQRRGHKLASGDVVQVQGAIAQVAEAQAP
jgi:ribosome-associated protein